jgi:hypothetical protein
VPLLENRIHFFAAEFFSAFFDAEILDAIFYAEFFTSNFALSKV